jgi:hypothetical protein
VKPRFFSQRLDGWLVALATFALYAPTLGFEFVYDDRVQILNNPWLDSWQWVPRYFTSHAAAFGGLNLGGVFWRPSFLFFLRLNQAWRWRCTRGWRG